MTSETLRHAAERLWRAKVTREMSDHHVAGLETTIAHATAMFRDDPGIRRLTIERDGRTARADLLRARDQAGAEGLRLWTTSTGIVLSRPPRRLVALHGQVVRVASGDVLTEEAR